MCVGLCVHRVTQGVAQTQKNRNACAIRGLFNCVKYEQHCVRIGEHTFVNRARARETDYNQTTRPNKTVKRAPNTLVLSSAETAQCDDTR